MRTTTGAALLGAMLLTGCVAPTAIVAPPVGVNLHPPLTTAYSVHTIQRTRLGADQRYNDEVIALLDAILGKRLESLGYTKALEGTPAQLNIDIAITAVSAGSQPARFLIGMGAGRALLTFSANFSDAKGQQIAAFDGGDSNTGTAHPFQSDQDVATYAAAESAGQIVSFLQLNGVMPVAKRKPPPGPGRN